MSPTQKLQSRGSHSSKDAGISPRKIPVQARSRERVQRILDAAAHILIEEGYNSVKTNLIAKRAGVSIGSVYQFFPNRLAIINALGERYQAKLAQVLLMYMGPDAPKDRSWQETLIEIVDILAEMWREDWALHSVWSAVHNTTELTESEEDFREQLIETLLVSYWKQYMPNKSDEQLKIMSTVAFETSNLLLDNSMRHDGTQDNRIVDELKKILNCYYTRNINESNTMNSKNE